MNKFSVLYDELVEISKELLGYYDIDKIKPYSVYVWTKEEPGENVFDIMTNSLVLYNREHIVIEEAKPIIERIQQKLQEINDM